ncbi:MAG TPA: peroxide stress protein YaaA [Gaiellaceae bacterium]
MPVLRKPLILLPPSETKHAPKRGRPLDLAALSFPLLTAQREELLDAALRAAPATPAGRLYTGVLYTALGIPSLPARAAREIVIISAQFGALRAADRVPAYRRELAAAHWRDALREPLDQAAAGRVILDCRSSTYVAAWRPSAAVAAGWVHVAVVEDRDGARRVVSHMAKKTRGEVARHVLVTGARPRTPAELAAVVAEKFVCELEPPVRAGAPWRLTVVQRAV